MITPVRELVNKGERKRKDSALAAPRARKLQEEDTLDDWYSWMVIFRQREAEALARWRQARIPAPLRADRAPRTPTIATIRLLVGGTLIRLGEAVRGERSAAWTHFDG